VLTLAAGSELAAGLLAQRSGAPRDVRFDSTVAGWVPGQSVSIALTDRGFSASAVVSAVRVSLVSDTWWEYAIEATESGTYAGGYLEAWRELTGGGGGSAVTISGGGSSSGGAVALSSPAYLGGSRIASVPMGASPAYTPVLSWVPFYAAGSFSARVRVELWARSAGVAVTARLYNVTDSAVAGSSSAVTSATPVETSFTVAVVAGKAYRLEVVSGTASEGAYGIGQIESV
jgi:hypothetical protein